MTDFINLLTHSLELILFFLANLVGLLLIPFGLPGTMLQVLAAALLTVASDGKRMTWPWVGVFLGLAMLGELVDLLSGQWGTRKFGGSKGASWGALLGGIAGAMIGIPIPFVGSILASFAGTFAGALFGEMYVQRKLEPNLRVGIGALAGRAIGVCFKLGLGMTILFMSIAVLIR